MTFNYKNVFINETATITGPYESTGPLSKFFDKSYSEFYFGTKTWELAEIKLVYESVDILLSKLDKNKYDIDLFVAGDLLNQITASNYAATSIGIPFIGCYAACATSVLGMVICSNMIECGQINNAITCASSHNNAAEKQFRYPVEYGGPKPKTTTFTATGAASCYLSRKEKGIKVDCATLGVPVDSKIKDAYKMGGVMAIAAANTLYQHLKDTKREIGYYDLVLTGDLGKYGKEIFSEYLSVEYQVNLVKYDDCGTILYDIDKQPVYSGASGPSCAPLVTYSYIFDKMRNGEYSRVLLIATGALMSATMVLSKNSIPSIAHAVSLEVVE